jgi:integrative and conjugative element protein (TIGR02256 family)
LPSETGGILLGFFDTSRRIVYIADLLPAPPDSIERPTFFVRGSKGLRAALDSVTRTTRGQLEYVGEWHTHPDGCSVGASHDDKDLLEKLSRVMAEDGLPEVMLIAGEEGRLAVHLKECVSSA